jgi:hypothetical protein
MNQAKYGRSTPPSAGFAGFAGCSSGPHARDIRINTHPLIYRETPFFWAGGKPRTPRKPRTRHSIPPEGNTSTPEHVIPQSQPLFVVAIMDRGPQIGQVVAWKYQGSTQDLALDCVPTPEIVGIEGPPQIGYDWTDDGCWYFASMEEARAYLSMLKVKLAGS